MKKIMILAVACAALAACQPKAKPATNEAGTDTTAVAATDTTHYEGVVPAADGPGIRYELALANDSTDGFVLTETYLAAKDGKDETHTYNGKKEVMKKTVNGKEQTAYKFDLGKDGGVSYFLVVDDSTLRMVNEELEEAATGADKYDLKRK